MSITALSSTGQTSAAGQTQRSGHRGGMQKAFDAAAQALGVSTGDLRSALQSGQSMSSLAASKGVRTDTLTSAISGALTSANSSLSSGQASAIAQRLIAGPQGGQGGGGHHRPDRDGDGPGGKGGPPPAVGQAMDSLASTLGISSDRLKSDLQGGASLTDVAAANGTDADTLKTTLADALTKADPSLTTDQAGSLADDLIAGPAQQSQPDPFTRMLFDRQMSGSGATDTTGTSSDSATQAALQTRYAQYSSAQLSSAGSGSQLAAAL